MTLTKMLPLFLHAAALGLAASTALAELPAPPATPEAQAKAAEAAARKAWSDKTDAYQLCEAQDRVAARYRDGAAAAGKPVPAAAQTAACLNPGPFAYAATEQKPIEAAGAHSPTETAASPPSTEQPAATTNPTPSR